MSNPIRYPEQDCDIEQGSDVVKLIIQPKDRDLGGLSVRRVLPNSQQRKVGPWVFFDHMGPARFAAGKGIDVRPHPHINLATVTYLFDGEILHRDSLGSLQVIVPGDINLMIAGSGIVHSERERPEIRGKAHILHGLQLWLALPEEFEETAPEFIHYPASDIPSDIINGVSVRVMMGSAYGMTSPVKVYAETLYVEAHLQSGQSIAIPNAQERAVYIATGALRVRNTEIPEYSLVVISATDEAVILHATKECRIAVIGGEKLGDRHIEWNFVSSRKERIEQAKADWQAGRMPKVPGDEKEYIPLPE